ARDAPEAAARHAETLETPGVKAADDGLLADLADLGRFSGGENGLHDAFLAKSLPSPGPRRLRGCPDVRVMGRRDRPPADLRRRIDRSSVTASIATRVSHLLCLHIGRPAGKLEVPPFGRLKQ